MEMGVGGLWHYSNKLFPCLVHYCKSSATPRLSYNTTELQDHLKQMKAKYEAVHVEPYTLFYSMSSWFNCTAVDLEGSVIELPLISSTNH